MALLREPPDVPGIMDPPDGTNKKGDWHSTSRLLSNFALYYDAILIITVTRANGSLIIFREGFSQIAGLCRWQVAIPNRRYHQGSDHAVGISYGLLSRGWIRSIGYVQLCGYQLVR
jgi:hypothetical protein